LVIILILLGLCAAPVHAATMLRVGSTVPVAAKASPEAPGTRLSRAETGAMLLASLLFTLMVWRGSRARKTGD
jgi:hypothetical protein